MANILKYIVLILFLSASSVFGYGDYQTFEIIAPKASESGSPAIPSTHRCFYAYPGLTYTFKAQVIGGDYPYTFSLSGAPSGMTIGEHTGVITWTNPQSHSGTITLTVYDRDGDSTSSQWAITVGTTGWYFVDDSAEAGGDGSISSPYDSIDDIMALNDEDGRVYFREGTYAIPTYHAALSGWAYGANFNYNNSPHILITYPGESVTFTGYNWENCSAMTTPLYWDGFTFSSREEHCIVSATNCTYTTIVNCEFSGLYSSSINSNQGASIYTPAGSGMGYYLVMQNNVIHDYVNAAGIGSISQQEKGLFEDNEIYNQTEGTVGVVFAMKGSVKRSTIRHNNVHDINSGSICGASANGMFSIWSDSGPSEENEVCYNLFELVSGGYQAGRYNNSGNQGTLWSYRNTYVGPVAIQNQASGSCEGPFYFANDVMQNSASGVTTSYESCNTLENILSGASGIVDASGNLQGDYTSYLGTTGWQIADDEYYGSSPSTPTPTIRSGGIHSGGIR